MPAGRLLASLCAVVEKGNRLTRMRPHHGALACPSVPSSAKGMQWIPTMVLELFQAVVELPVNL